MLSGNKMKNKKFKAAIIGLGRIGFAYDLGRKSNFILSYSRALSRHQGFELAAGIDVDEKKLAQFRKIFKTSYAYHYSQLKKVLNGVDMVVIAVPTELHFKVFKDVISCHRPRMIVLEKPISNNLEEAKKIAKWCKKYNILLYVNYFRRVDKGILNLKSAIRKGEFGKLRHVNIYYGDDLLNNGSHFIDLIFYLLGKPNKVEILGGDKENPNFVFYYKDLFVFFKSMAAKKVNYNFKEMDFIFEKGRIKYSSSPDTQVFKSAKSAFWGTRELSPIADKGVYYLNMEKFMFNVVSYLHSVLKGKKKILSTGDTALETLETCFDLLKN